MIAGLGIDLVAVHRVEKLLTRHGHRFLARCFSPGELVRPDDPEHLAGILAAKEAAFKALNPPFPSGIGWRDIAIVHELRSGRPSIIFHGQAAVVASKHDIIRIHLSITHQAGIAAAVVIVESGTTPGA